VTKKRFAVLDGDSHIVETPALWEEYLAPEFRTLGKTALWREEGEHGSYLKINGKIFRDTVNSNIPRHAIWRPGMTWDKIGSLDPTQRHPITAGASDPQARLRDMDAMGIDQAFLYPTWFAEGFHLVEEPDVANALARAYKSSIRNRICLFLGLAVTACAGSSPPSMPTLPTADTLPVDDRTSYAEDYLRARITGALGIDPHRRHCRAFRLVVASVARGAQVNRRLALRNFQGFRGCAQVRSRQQHSADD
jgi:hypothetical protein